LDRLAQLGPRPEGTSALARLPEPWLVGLTEVSDIVVVAENAQGQDSAPFTLVSTSAHTGWVHDGGFSITISKPTQDGDRWIHEIEAVIDPDVALNLADHPRLWGFLERCTDDAVLFPQHNPRMRLEAAMIRKLRNAHFLAKCLRDATTLPGSEAIDAPLRVASDAESLHTVALLAEAATHPTFLERFGFVIEIGSHREDYTEVSVTCEVPVVANLTGEQGVVCWFDASATYMILDGTVRGIRLDEIRGANVEVIGRQHKATEFPELVIDRTWPPIALTPRGVEQSASDARDWPVELQEAELP